jgi:hypothetical protein
MSAGSGRQVVRLTEGSEGDDRTPLVAEGSEEVVG